jgi:redox-sensitive bicupin YhaK (pirin superfamily)
MNMNRKIAREVQEVLVGRPTLEGAGVRLRRAFGYHEVPKFDPFLMLDDFGSNDPDDYLAGFPWHPHRGIETVTYMLSGEVDHCDSIGNSGVIGSGDVQWMTAGSGIIHQEMPRRARARMRGFQLWVNLPRRDKMMTPRYRDVKRADIPEVRPAPGVRVRVVSGTVAGVRGPVQDIVVDPEYLDVSIAPGVEFRHAFPRDDRVFAYVVDGDSRFGGGKAVGPGHVVLFGAGDEVAIAAGDSGVRLLLVSGRPLNEPVAWGGPIVMNTRAELDRAFGEYRQGTFIKHGRDPEAKPPEPRA